MRLKESTRSLILFFRFETSIVVQLGFKDRNRKLISVHITFERFFFMHLRAYCCCLYRGQIDGAKSLKRSLKVCHYYLTMYFLSACH
jgi:hypothetical protein